MREPRNFRSKKNRAVPFQAAFLLLLAGLGTAAYFVELRGVGFVELLATEMAPELVIVGGALLALALVTHLGVSRAMAEATGVASLRGVLRHALTLADASPDAMEDGIVTLPSEAQELVRMLVAQRLRSEGTGREIQSLRHEINAIQQGMQRSALSLEPMRLEGGEFGRAVSTAWNQMLERVRSAPANRSTSLQDSTASLEIQSLRQRLEVLESRCGRMEEDMLSLQTATPAGAEGLFADGTRDLVLEDSGTAKATAASSWQASVLPEAEADLALPTQDAPADGTSDYHEWTGRASAGDWKLNREAQQAFTVEAEKRDRSAGGASFGRSGAEDLVLEPTDSTPPPARPFVDDTYERAAGDAPVEASQSSEFAFPHFVGKPAGPTDGRVEVTFEGKRPSPPAAKDEMLSVDPDGSATRPGSVIFDLRSLGAVELDD